MNRDIKERVKNAKRIVIKVGTSTLTYANGNLNLSLLNKLAWGLSDLRNQGRDVVLVTSGAIGVGSKKLDFKTRPKETREKQAAAAVGQAELMHIYQNFFGEYSQKTAQILLTKDDFKEGERKTNTNNTFEIEFSDNDRLSASVASLLKADLLIILTDIDALYNSNPKTNPDAQRIAYVEKVTDEIMKMGGEKGSEFSVGGMETKLLAARECCDNGVVMAILDGSNPLLIEKLISGEDVGTVFDCMA